DGGAMNALWRLVWALPLVLATGAAVMLLLRRVVPIPGNVRAAAQLKVRETLNLSDETRVHLVEIERQRFLVVESSRNAVLQSVQASAQLADAKPRLGPAWARRLLQARSS